MAKVIPYQAKRFQPIDFKRADDHAGNTGQEGQLDLFSQVQPLQLPLAENTFELALKLDLRNDPSAEQYYLKSIEKKEHIAHSYCNLGVIAAHRQKMAQAIDYFSRALVEEPRHCESHFNLANVYFVAGNTGLAVLHYEVVTLIDPEFADVYYNLGLAFLEMEELKSAKACFQKFKKLCPGHESDSVNVLLKSLSSLV